MTDNKKYGILLGLFLMVCGFVVLSKMSDAPLSIRQSRLPESIKGQWEGLQLSKIQAEEAENLLAMEKANQARQTLVVAGELERAAMPGKQIQRRTAGLAVFWGIFAACVAAFLIVSAGVSVGVAKIMQANGDVLVMALVANRRRTKDENQLLMVEARERIAMLRSGKADALYLAEQDKQQAIDVAPSQAFVCPDALQCLQRGYFPHDDNFLAGFSRETTDPARINFRGLKTSANIIGGQGSGKTNTEVNYGVQSLLKGWTNMWIDFHYEHRESFIARMGSLKDLPNVRYYNEADDAAHAFCLIEKILRARLANKIPCTPPLLIIIDELLETSYQLKEAGVDVDKTLRDVVMQGRKADMWILAAAHVWKAKDMLTEIKRNMRIHILHQTDYEEGKVFCGNKEAAKAAKYLEAGETVTVMPNGKLVPITVPFWRPEAINLAATKIQPVEFPSIEVQAEDIVKYGRPTLVVSNEPKKKLRIRGY
jgi:hypothetical protein